MTLRALVMDGVEIPESLVAQEVQNHPAATAAESRAAAAHALAIKALLLDRARELGLTPEPEVDDAGREETAEEALVRAVLDAEVAADPPGEAECRRVYESRRGSFRSPPLLEASHILVEMRGTDLGADAAARNTAERAIAMLVARQCSFAELAGDISDCPSGVQGGSLGQLQPGDLAPEIEAALESLAPGEVAARPVRSRFGWHVLRLERRIEERQAPFEIVEPRIRLALESRAWMAAAVRYVAGLADEARGRGIALTLGEDCTVAQGSRTLGEFLSADAADRLEPWLVAVDPAFAQRVAAAAGEAGVSTPTFVRDAVAQFIAEADDEAWTRLISAAQGADDPALAGMSALLRTRVEPAKRVFTVIKRA